MRTVLAARLPRAYDETGAGVAPVDPEDRIVGVSVNHDAIASAGLEMKQRLTDEVIFPLQQWLAAYRSIKARVCVCGGGGVWGGGGVRVLCVRVRMCACMLLCGCRGCVVASMGVYWGCEDRSASTCACARVM